MPEHNRLDEQFAICTDATDFPVALEAWKIYRVLPDADAERHGQIRVVDESGEDYLFPCSRFRLIDLPDDLKARFVKQTQI